MTKPTYEELESELRAATETLLQIRVLIRTMDRGVGCRNPYDHDTYGSYAEGRADFAGEVEDILGYPEDEELAV